DVLPQTLSRLELNLNANQRQMETINVKELLARIPDFGVSLAVDAESRLGSDFKPKAAAANIGLTVDHSGSQSLPGRIRTAGKVEVKTRVATDDMKKVLVDGRLQFDQFN